jgi:hypothetical protein
MAFGPSVNHLLASESFVRAGRGPGSAIDIASPSRTGWPTFLREGHFTVHESGRWRSRRTSAPRQAATRPDGCWILVAGAGRVVAFAHSTENAVSGSFRPPGPVSHIPWFQVGLEVSEACKCSNGSSSRVGDDALRSSLKAARHTRRAGATSSRRTSLLRVRALPRWTRSDRDPGSFRTFLDHQTMRYVHVQQPRVKDAWAAGQQRAAKWLEGLLR